MFNVFKKILRKEDISEEDKGKISEYVMMNWLSGDPTGQMISNVFNVYDIPLDAKIKFIQRVLPGSTTYIKYPKKEKFKDENVEVVSKFYNVTFTEARELLELMDDDQLIEIINTIKSQKSAKLRGRN